MRYFLDLVRDDAALRDFVGIDLMDGDVYKLRELVASIIADEEPGRYAGWQMIVHDIYGKTIVIYNLDKLQTISH